LDIEDRKFSRVAVSSDSHTGAEVRAHTPGSDSSFLSTGYLVNRIFVYITGVQQVNSGEDTPVILDKSLRVDLI
jgi:hypothetical protein